MDKNARLKQAFESATSAEEKLKALKNMAANGFKETELRHQIWKYIEQLSAQTGSITPQHFMAFDFADKACSKKWKGKQADLKHAFHAANSADEMLQALTKMEPHFQEKDLGSHCFKLAQRLHLERKDPEKILFYGKRALKFFIDCNNSYTSSSFSLMIANVVCLLCSACSILERYEESISYLNWGLRNFSNLESDKSFPVELVWDGLKKTHFELAMVKMVLERREEVVVHRKKILEIVEKEKKGGDFDIGKACMGVADAYLSVGNFEEAIPFVLRALEIYAKRLGDDSVEISRVRKCIVDIQDARKECDDESLEHNVLSVMLEECGDAIGAVVWRADNLQSEDLKAGALIAMARDLCNQKKFDDAKKHMKKAQRILDKKETDPLVLATGLEDLSKMYEQMKESGIAILLLRRALAIPELPHDRLLDCSSRLFSLVSLTGKNKKGIAYLEEVVERLKEVFGTRHCQVGYGYKRLGDSYIKLGKLETGVKLLALAKDIMDVTLGPHHLDSLQTSQTLSMTYADIKRYDQALEIQEQVVEGFKGLRLTERGKLDEAVGLLKQMKVRASRILDKNVKQ